jgi:hypothetical protein
VKGDKMKFLLQFITLVFLSMFATVLLGISIDKNSVGLLVASVFTFVVVWLIYQGADN